LAIVYYEWAVEFHDKCSPESAGVRVIADVEHPSRAGGCRRTEPPALPSHECGAPGETAAEAAH